LALATACGGAHVETDPTDYLAVGVDPATEAQSLEAALSASGMRVTREVRGENWFAFAMTRADGASLARVVTHRGVVVALDESASALAPARGVLDVRDAPPRDVDGDGTVDVVLVRTESDRTCEMIVGVDADGATHALVVDASTLPADACIEDVRDVDGSATPEAIVRVRAHALARGVVPTADLPLERDATGVYRRVDPAERFVASERSFRATRLAAARAVPDAGGVYTLAIELALVSYVAGEAPDAQLAAFDDAIAGVVLDVDQLQAVHDARIAIAAGHVAD
jgi:hypothetical protein